MKMPEYKSDFDCLGFSDDLVSRPEGKCCSVAIPFLSPVCLFLRDYNPYLSINPIRNPFHEERDRV